MLGDNQCLSDAQFWRDVLSWGNVIYVSSLLCSKAPDWGEGGVPAGSRAIRPWEQTDHSLHIPGVSSTPHTLALAPLSTERTVSLILTDLYIYPTHILLSPYKHPAIYPGTPVTTSYIDLSLTLNTIYMYPALPLSPVSHILLAA